MYFDYFHYVLVYNCLLRTFYFYFPISRATRGSMLSLDAVKYGNKMPESPENEVFNVI